MIKKEYIYEQNTRFEVQKIQESTNENFYDIVCKYDFCIEPIISINNSNYAVKYLETSEFDEKGKIKRLCSLDNYGANTLMPLIDKNKTIFDGTILMTIYDDAFIEFCYANYEFYGTSIDLIFKVQIDKFISTIYDYYNQLDNEIEMFSFDYVKKRKIEQTLTYICLEILDSYTNFFNLFTKFKTEITEVKNDKEIIKSTIRNFIDLITKNELIDSNNIILKIIDRDRSSIAEDTIYSYSNILLMYHPYLNGHSNDFFEFKFNSPLIQITNNSSIELSYNDSKIDIDIFNRDNSVYTFCSNGEKIASIIIYKDDDNAEFTISKNVIVDDNILQIKPYYEFRKYSSSEIDCNTEITITKTHNHNPKSNEDYYFIKKINMDKFKGCTASRIIVCTTETINGEFIKSLYVCDSAFESDISIKQKTFSSYNINKNIYIEDKSLEEILTNTSKNDVYTHTIVYKQN